MISMEAGLAASSAQHAQTATNVITKDNPYLSIAAGFMVCPFAENEIEHAAQQDWIDCRNPSLTDCGRRIRKKVKRFRGRAALSMFRAHRQRVIQQLTFSSRKLPRRA